MEAAAAAEVNDCEVGQILRPIPKNGNELPSSIEQAGKLLKLSCAQFREPSELWNWSRSKFLVMTSACVLNPRRQGLEYAVSTSNACT